MGVFSGGVFSSGAVSIRGAEYRIENSNSLTTMAYTFSKMQNDVESYIIIDVNKVNTAMVGLTGIAGASLFGLMSLNIQSSF
jgi:hypothetical protein